MRTFLVCLIALFAVPISAQERPQAVLVLDASGSMWGQIDGVTKIEIARSVISDLLTTLDVDQNLGLTVYGHRVKGKCTDIETLVQPGAGTRDAIARAVNRIRPVGMTPLSDAVIQAAEALKYNEAAATVILVTDGLETCDRDPCAVGRALEENGVDFTTHVIGFDVAEEDRAQLQCLADETGGMFISASNANELSLALNDVSEEMAAPPPVPVRFVATEGDGGAPLGETLIWDLSGPEGRIFTGVPGADAAAELPLGDGYRVTALRPSDQTIVAADFTVNPDTATVTLVFQPAPAAAEVTGPDEAGVATTIAVGWSGPDSDKDYLSIGTPGENDYLDFVYTRDANPGELRMPDEPGVYELRYQLADRTVLATRAITVVDAEATLTAPDTAPIAALLDVGWTGPDTQNDYVAVALPGEKSYVAYGYTRSGSPAEVRMPDTPGIYELRYHLGRGRVLATRRIEITDVGVTLNAPDTAPIGAMIAVDWSGPGEQSDYISIALPGEDGYIGYGYTRNGNPTEVRMPDEPGAYELRYQLGTGGKILATRAITATAISVSLDAPETAPLGSVVDVGWVGPDEQGDFIAIAEPGEDGYVGYGYTRGGNPAQVRMPSETGSYELRYQLGATRKVLASRPIEVIGVDVSIDAPDTATIGSVVDVTWVGPDEQGDYISVADPDEKSYIGYGYTRRGNPAEVRMPDSPGTYELRYQLGAGGRVLASRVIEVTGLDVSINAPESAPMGSVVDVAWVGPDEKGDYISVALPDEKRYVGYGYTRRSNPAEVRMPDSPGTYELRYQLGQGGRVLASRLIEVTLVEATLSAAPGGPAGGEITVEWTGPDYEGDFIGIGLVGERYERYALTDRGNPATVRLPDQPGEYELRYYLRRGGKVLATLPVTVTE